MDFPFYTTLVALFSIVLKNSCHCVRLKRNNIDNFNVLLSLFKVKPLENSKVFKSFSNTMLLPANDPVRLSDTELNDLEYLNENIVPLKKESQENDLESTIIQEPSTIQETLAQEPLKVKLPEVISKKEPYFDPVNKLEYFDEQDDPYFTPDNIGDIITMFVNNKQNKKPNQLQEAENFIAQHGYYVSKDEEKRFLRDAKYNADEEIDDVLSEEIGTDEPLIIR